VSPTAASERSKPAILLCQLLGIALFAVAFFLPAVSTGPGAPLKGWECAVLALANVIHAETYRSPSFLAAMSGLINPFILLYLLGSLIPPFRRSRALSTVRILLAVLIVLGMIATWIFFAVAHLSPRIGHFLWIAGALLILCGELRRGAPAPAPAP
jgi:hypothetical protein